MSNEFKSLPPKPGQLEINRRQGVLDLEIDKQAAFQGIGMGVLKDGTPFFESARACPSMWR
jgi:hypothetical protein